MDDSQPRSRTVSPWQGSATIGWSSPRAKRVATHQCLPYTALQQLTERIRHDHRHRTTAVPARLADRWALSTLSARSVDTAVDALTTRIVARAAARRAAASNSEADRRAIEAAQVRRRADQHRHDSPGFAADLFAAADRHESRRIAEAGAAARAMSGALRCQTTRPQAAAGLRSGPCRRQLGRQVVRQLLEQLGVQPEFCVPGRGFEPITSANWAGVKSSPSQLRSS